MPHSQARLSFRPHSLVACAMCVVLTTASAAELNGAKAPGRSQESQLEEAKATQQELLARLRREMSTIPVPSKTNGDESPASRERRDRYFQLSRQLTEIEKRINREGGIRTRFVSAATEEPALRNYYTKLTARIEDFGTKNFPKYGDVSLYGRVTVLFTVRKNGRIESIDVTSSPSKILATHASWIVRELEPFDPFAPEIATETDQIAISASFNFTK